MWRTSNRGFWLTPGACGKGVGIESEDGGIIEKRVERNPAGDTRGRELKTHPEKKTWGLFLAHGKTFTCRFLPGSMLRRLQHLPKAGRFSFFDARKGKKEKNRRRFSGLSGGAHRMKTVPATWSRKTLPPSCRNCPRIPMWKGILKRDYIDPQVDELLQEKIPGFRITSRPFT